MVMPMIGIAAVTHTATLDSRRLNDKLTHLFELHQARRIRPITLQNNVLHTHHEEPSSITLPMGRAAIPSLFCSATS